MFDQFYHGSIRRYVIAFGSLFNDISLVRTATDGSEVQRMKVPISYGPKEKFLVRLAQDPTLTNPLGMVLPRMAFEITNIAYDSSRKLNRMNRRAHFVIGDQASAYRQFVEVPYNIDFDLSIMTRTTEDGTQILEQILPYWTPDYTVTINTIPEMGLSLDVPVILNHVQQTDSYEGNFDTRRALIWRLAFTMRAAIYGPVKKSGVITSVKADTYVVPSGASMQPPTYLRNEDGSRIQLEDGSGYLLDETDPGDLASADRVSEITVTPDPPNAKLGDTFDFDVTITHD